MKKKNLSKSHATPFSTTNFCIIHIKQNQNKNGREKKLHALGDWLTNSYELCSLTKIIKNLRKIMDVGFVAGSLRNKKM